MKNKIARNFIEPVPNPLREILITQAVQAVNGFLELKEKYIYIYEGTGLGYSPKCSQKQTNHQIIHSF